MAVNRPKLGVIGGWGVKPDLLKPWLNSLADLFDIQVVEIPDLGAAKALSRKQRNAELLAQLPSGSYWLGWSLGGAIALDLAADAPDAVAGVITLATNPSFVGQPHWPGMPVETFVSFANSYKEDAAKTLQRFASLQVAGACDPRSQLRELKAALVQPQAVLSNLLELLAEDRRDQLLALKPALLMLLADADALVPPSLYEVLSAATAACATAKVSLVNGASHLLFQDQPEQLTAQIEAWYRKLEALQDAI